MPESKYRADQVGSFLRPPKLKEAIAAHAAGRLSADELRQAQDEAILEVIELQRQAGVDVFSDGEYRRDSWASDFAHAVDGYVVAEPPVVLRWSGASIPQVSLTPPAGGAGGAARASGGTGVIGRKLVQKASLTGHEAAFLKQHAPGAYKVTMPSASYVVARGYKPGVTDKAYASRAEVLHDVAAIIGAEIKALVAMGVPYIQLDNPHYPDYIPEERRAQWRAIGIDPDQALSEDIAADNETLRGFDRSNVTLAMHLCRGNGGRGGWHTAGGYDRIAEEVFSRVEVDRWLLEYDSDRAGGFEPLRYMPRGKVTVLGLVTTKSGELESQETLLRRIEEASQFVPADELALSPQCGFASVLEGNPLTWDEQRRKLDLVVQTARRVWG